MEPGQPNTRERPSGFNPYASPTVEASPAPSAAEVKKRLRWRLIPVMLLYVFGGLMLAGMVLRCGFDVWVRVTRPDALELGLGPTGPMLVGDFLGLIAAGLYLLTARRLWQRRWWSAGAAFCVALLLAFVSGRLSPFE